MNKNRKQLLLELKKIAAHFRLTLSKTDIVRKTAIALDSSNKKLLVMDESDRPYFRTIDLKNVGNCSVKVDYRSIGAGDLNGKNMDEFIDKIQLQISHLDPKKSVSISFYDMKRNTVKDLKALVEKATMWRDKITSMLSPIVLIPA